MSDPRHTVRRRPASSGFTLIEVLIAASILAMVVGLTWGSFNQTFHAKEVIEKNSERYHMVRLAMNRLTRELGMAFLSLNDDTTQEFRRTFFIGKQGSDVDEVAFAMMGHQRLYADSPECDTSQVKWFGIHDPDDPDKIDLARRETRRLSNEKIEDAPGRTDIMCEDIVSLRLSYYDWQNKEWRDEWNTTTADGQQGRLPTEVKITLTIKDERGNEVPFTTIVRIAMQEPLDTSFRKSQQ